MGEPCLATVNSRISGRSAAAFVMFGQLNAGHTELHLTGTSMMSSVVKVKLSEVRALARLYAHLILARFDNVRMELLHEACRLKPRNAAASRRLNMLRDGQHPTGSWPLREGSQPNGATAKYLTQN